ncbi:MAG: GNAT family N-acetyltransferase [Prolixibacteraceae bacterium]|nr:GNAT family N-acetyltransferase [Prolixibacteraceae bacterium]
MIQKASAKRKDYIQIAYLHFTTITKGFLTRLGISFLNSLYRFLIKKELVIVYKEHNKIKGFVSCARSSEGLMKRFFISSPTRIIKLGVAIIKYPKLIKSLLETFRAPNQSKSSHEENIVIPETELLSISVAPSAQQGGIGSQLLNALEEELKTRDITSYKVVAGEKLQGANKFYKKHGFVLAKQITIHGDDISNVYVKELK